MNSEFSGHLSDFYLRRGGISHAPLPYVPHGPQNGQNRPGEVDFLTAKRQSANFDEAIR